MLPSPFSGCHTPGESSVLVSLVCVSCCLDRACSLLWQMTCQPPPPSPASPRLGHSDNSASSRPLLSGRKNAVATVMILFVPSSPRTQPTCQDPAGSLGSRCHSACTGGESIRGSSPGSETPQCPLFLVLQPPPNPCLPPSIRASSTSPQATETCPQGRPRALRCLTSCNHPQPSPLPLCYLLSVWGSPGVWVWGSCQGQWGLWGPQGSSCSKPELGTWQRA